MLPREVSSWHAWGLQVRATAYAQRILQRMQNFCNTLAKTGDTVLQPETRRACAKEMLKAARVEPPAIIETPFNVFAMLAISKK